MLETHTNNETVRTPRSVSVCFRYVLSSLCMFFFMVCVCAFCVFFPLPAQSHHMLSMGPSASPTLWQKQMAAHPGNAFEGNMGPDGPMWAEQNPKWIVYRMSSYWNPFRKLTQTTKQCAHLAVYLYVFIYVVFVMRIFSVWFV